MIRMFRKRKSAPTWSTPKGYFTPFGLNGDPAMDGHGEDPDERRRALYMQVFSTSDGRLVLGDMLALAGVGRPPFEPGGSRDDATYYSGSMAFALAVARLAGCETGALGRAVVEGKLEEMTNARTDDDSGDTAE